MEVRRALTHTVYKLKQLQELHVLSSGSMSLYAYLHAFFIVQMVLIFKDFRSTALELKRYRNNGQTFTRIAGIFNTTKNVEEIRLITNLWLSFPRGYKS